MAVVKKKLQVKWYDRDLTFLKLEDNLKNVPSWRWETGKGLLDTRIDLDYEFDDLPSHIQSNNIVRIFEVSADNPEGIEVYRGIVGEIRPFLRASDQGVTVEALGLNSVLQWAYFKDGASFTVSYTSTDIADIFEDIIDDWQTVHSSTLISYTGSSIDTTGNTVTIDIEDKKHSEALQEVFQYADADWYWYIDVDGVVYLKELPATATHTFTVGKDVTVSRAPENYKQVLNQQTIFYSGGSVTVNSSSSITSYGLHEGKLIRDDNIGDSGTATNRATAIVDNGKDPKVNGTIEATSTFSNLPSIRPGDTIKLQNYNQDGSILTDNMPIVSLQYDWDNATMEIGEIRTNFARELNNFLNTVS